MNNTINSVSLIRWSFCRMKSNYSHHCSLDDDHFTLQLKLIWQLYTLPQMHMEAA